MVCDKSVLVRRESETDTSQVGERGHAEVADKAVRQWDGHSTAEQGRFNTFDRANQLPSSRFQEHYCHMKTHFGASKFAARYGTSSVFS